MYSDHHMDPVAIEDEEVAVLKAEVLSVIKGLDSHINMHVSVLSEVIHIRIWFLTLQFHLAISPQMMIYAMQYRKMSGKSLERITIP